MKENLEIRKTEKKLSSTVSTRAVLKGCKIFFLIGTSSLFNHLFIIRHWDC